jgi:hypothetical protein
MYSILKPNVLYQDTSPDVTEHDINVVSDLWEMDGRSVYRGARDPRYTHANVYWLYNEDLERVGCSEHSLEDHANFHLLWFHESPFGTLLQEEGWKVGDDIWSYLPRHTTEKFFHEGWTTPVPFLEQCLHGPLRIVTVETLVNLPMVYSCEKCNRKSLTKFACSTTATPLDFPQKEKVFFVDADLVVHFPPPTSKVFKTLRLCGDDLQEQPEQEVQSASLPLLPPDVAPLPLAEAPQSQQEQ